MQKLIFTFFDRRKSESKHKHECGAKKINEHLKDWKEKRLFFLPFLFVLGGGVWFGLFFLDWDMRKKRDAGAKCCVPNSCEFIVELNAAVV